MQKTDILPPSSAEGEQMPYPNLVSCSRCESEGRSTQAEVMFQSFPGTNIEMELRGVLRCKRDSHEWPITLNTRHQVRAVDVELPAADSKKLNPDVPGGIKEDVQEAERAHFSQNYKASVVMCRRALQLALEDVMKVTAGPLLGDAKKQPKRLLSDTAFALADRVKDYGDGGAHGKAVLDPKAVEVVIFDTVSILNELYQKKVVTT